MRSVSCECGILEFTIKAMPEVLDSPQQTSTADFYQLIHEQISSEDSSMNQRVNWLIISDLL